MLSRRPFITKPAWCTLAIGRHLVDVPLEATVIEQWKFNRNRLELVTIRDDAHFKQIVDQREVELHRAKHKTRETMFVDKWLRPQGGITLI